MASTGAVDIRDLIDSRPIGRYQILVGIMCGLIVFIDGYDAQAMGYVAPAITKALAIPRDVLGRVISAALVGMMIGALGSGPLADRIGRKPVLVMCALVFGAGSLLTAMASTVNQLLLVRLITGFGMGGAMPNAIALTSEFMPTRRRAGGVAMMFCGFSAGAAIGGVIAAAIIPRFGWQSVFLVGGVIPIAVGVTAAFVLPESIRFLLIKGQHARARAYLRRVMGAPASGELSAGAGEYGEGSNPVIELFKDGRGAATLFLWVVYFMNLLNLYFLNSWLPTIINDAGIPVATALRLTSLFQAGGIVGGLLLGRLLDKRPSFAILAGCYVWAAACIYLIGIAGVSVLWFAATITGAGFGIIGGQNVANALSSEFYPTRMRSTGVGWALGIGRIGSIAGPLIGGIILTQGTATRQIFWAATIPALVAALAAAAVVLTKPRRSPMAVHGAASNG